jgi:hypothetical protein
MSLVADYGSDDENTSSSSESEQVSKPTVTVDTPSICGIRRPGLAAFLPPPKRTRTEPASDKASTVTEGGKRKVQIVVPLPEPATSSDEEDETKRQPTTTTHSKTSQASSGLCAFLPPPKNRKPVGQSGSSTAASRSSFGNVASHTGSTQRVLGGGVAHARDILGIATGDDAEPLDTSDVSEKPSTASSASTNSDVGSGHSVNSMIPYSLLKRKKTTNTNQNNTSKETESFDADLGLLPTEVEDTSYEAYTTSKPSSSSISAAPGAASEQETDKSDTRHDQTMYQYNTTYTATDMYGYYQTNGIGDTTTLSDEAVCRKDIFVSHLYLTVFIRLPHLLVDVRNAMISVL